MGLLTPQDYEFLKGRTVGLLFTIMERQLQGQFVMYPDGANAPTGDIVAYEYMSRYGVVPSVARRGQLTATLGGLAATTYSTNDYVDSGGICLSVRRRRNLGNLCAGRDRDRLRWAPELDLCLRLWPGRAHGQH